jgi:hypothetical protein
METTEAPKETLPFAVPKKVPRWVLGFPNFLKNELQVDDPDVITVHDSWLRFETQYWELYHKKGKPRQPRKKKDPESDSISNPELDGDTNGPTDGTDEPPAKQSKVRLDVRVKNKWKQRFERLRKIAREHAIAALESEVNDMEKDLDDE